MTRNFGRAARSCVNYDILMSKERKNCLCTGMLYDPAWDKEKKEEPQEQGLRAGGRRTVERKRWAAPAPAYGNSPRT